MEWESSGRKEIETKKKKKKKKQEGNKEGKIEEESGGWSIVLK